MSKQFVSLHTHTAYSKLDGASKISGLVSRAKELGMPGIGISDHGTVSGIIDFYKECKKQDVKPILGMEAYFADDRLERTGVKQSDSNGDIDGSNKSYYHLSVFAENNEGYHNLLKISSDAYINGLYRKPRTDWSFLESHSEGIIVASGCLGGPVLQPLLHNNYLAAKTNAARFQDIVGKDNFFIELMDHDLPEQRRTNPLLLQIAREIGAPTILTQDTHYTHKEDCSSHEVLLCCQTGAKLSDPKRFKFHNHEYYLKPSEYMRSLGDWADEACDNTLLIAERACVDIDFKTQHLPLFDVPEGFDSDVAYLRHLAYDGAKARYGELSNEVIDRLEYELSVIDSMGVSSYFLILWDIMLFAQSEGILSGPGRGSACGSIVSYCLRITHVEPLEYGLIFERFLNPSRITMPDVDLDWEQRHRETIINYTSSKYGSDYVAQIATFGTIKARTAVRDTVRILDLPFSLGGKISEAMPKAISGVDIPLWACLEEDPKFEAGYHNAQALRDMYNSNSEVKEVIDVALGLEGLIRQSGIHAAGLVIGDRPLTELVPLETRKDGSILTQWDKKAVEDVGLLKMDFLGLKTLDVLADCIKMVGITLEDIPIDDIATYEMLKLGETVGCFQIESSGMRDLLRNLRPTNIRDISAVLALYRPGPMAQNWHNDYADRKNGRQAAVPFHEDARDILAETYQIPLYQEQLMKISQVFAGYSMAEADNLRKIIGRKETKAMTAERGKFVDGCVVNGYDADFSEDLFDKIDGFSLYGFSSLHSMPYAHITFWTAYLKRHYPREFMACLCSSVMGELDKVALYLYEARRMGLNVHAPDVNTSNSDFSVTDDGIRIGLRNVRNIGVDLSEMIRSERPYKTLYDFARRINPSTTAMQSLALSGALDAYGTRLGIYSVSVDLLKSTRNDNTKNNANQSSLFDNTELVDITIPEQEYGLHEMLAKEKEYIGMYVSGHPLSDYTSKMAKHTLSDLPTMGQEKGIKVLCIISSIEVKFTKKHESMAIIQVEDQTGSMEVVAFPRNWKKVNTLKAGDVVHMWIRPGIDYREERHYTLASLETVDSNVVQVDNSRTFGVYLPLKFGNDPTFMSKLKGVFLINHGSVPVSCYISRSATIDLGNIYSVEPNDTLKNSIKSLFIEFSNKKGNIV